MLSPKKIYFLCYNYMSVPVPINITNMNNNESRQRKRSQPPCGTRPINSLKHNIEEACWGHGCDTEKDR